MSAAESAPAVVEAAQELYGGAPGDFIARRKVLAAEVKAAGDPDSAAEIGRLRKPDVAAWAINLTVRQRSDVAADLVGLGARMRAAQSALDGAALQGMRQERDAAIRAFVAAAVDVVSEQDVRLAPAAQDAVRATAIAVLADAGASDAVATALLTRPLSYSGFGEVDLSDAVAVTGSGVVLTALHGGGHGDPDRPTADEKPEAVRRERARAALREAESQEARAQDSAELAATRLEEAETDLAAARARYDEALRAAETARTADAEARAAVTAAIRASKKAAARQRCLQARNTTFQLEGCVTAPTSRACQPRNQSRT